MVFSVEYRNLRNNALMLKRSASYPEAYTTIRSMKRLFYYEYQNDVQIKAAKRVCHRYMLNGAPPEEQCYHPILVATILLGQLVPEIRQRYENMKEVIAEYYPQVENTVYCLCAKRSWSSLSPTLTEWLLSIKYIGEGGMNRAMDHFKQFKTFDATGGDYHVNPKMRFIRDEIDHGIVVCEGGRMSKKEGQFTEKTIIGVLGIANLPGVTTEFEEDFEIWRRNEYGVASLLYHLMIASGACVVSKRIVDLMPSE